MTLGDVDVAEDDDDDDDDVTAAVDAAVAACCCSISTTLARVAFNCLNSFRTIFESSSFTVWALFFLLIVLKIA